MEPENRTDQWSCKTFIADLARDDHGARRDLYSFFGAFLVLFSIGSHADLCMYYTLGNRIEKAWCEYLPIPSMTLPFPLHD